MNKEINELINTLNGGLQQLPDLAKQMVNQYVVGHWVLGIILLIAAVLVSFGLLHLYKDGVAESKNSDYYDDGTGYFVAAAVGSLIPFTLFICAVISIYEACTPIWSIIQALR